MTTQVRDYKKTKTPRCDPRGFLNPASYVANAGPCEILTRFDSTASEQASNLHLHGESMSIALMSQVWKVTLEPSLKLVLLALADNASDQGECWPSIDNIARKSCRNRRNTFAALAKLERLGHISKAPRNGHSTTFTVHPLVSLATPVSQETPRGVAGDTSGGVAGDTQNHKVESSRTLKAKSDSRSANTDATGILRYLNEITGKAFRPVDATLKPIIARLKEGYSVERLRTIAFTKNQQWGGDERMAEYLRPATLFNATKCAQYDGELS